MNLETLLAPVKTLDEMVERPYARWRESIEDSGTNAYKVTLVLNLQASSVYLKSADPKVLDKDSVWQKAYDWCAQKLSRKQPVLVPVK